MSQNEPSDNDPSKSDIPQEPDTEEIPQPIKKVINQQTDVIDSLTKENISLRAEIKDIREAMPEMAKAGAAEMLKALGVNPDAQAQPQANTVQVNQSAPGQNTALMPGQLAIPNLDANTIQALGNLANVLKDLYDKFSGQNPDATTTLSFTNYKSFVKLQETIMQNLIQKAWRNVASEFNLKTLPQEAQTVIDHAIS